MTPSRLTNSIVWNKALPKPHKVGGGTSPLIVQANYDESTDATVLDKTWLEINEAYRSGRTVKVITQGLFGSAFDICRPTESGGKYYIHTYYTDVSNSNVRLVLQESYSTEQEDGYPKYSEAN